ncbi:MAG TPA: DedA family protein [Ktedonobacter sp.]|nr:DedA family protein [Ktedonobacter sp.]
MLKEATSLLTNITQAITVWIYNLYGFTGLAGIVLAMAIESCCIPLPSEIVMPIAGIIVGSYYTSNPLHLPGTSPSFPLWLNLVLVALAGSIGCLIGSIVAYAIGSTGGRPLMLKYGRYVLISQHDADKADRFFQRWGSATAFFSRLLPVVRTYISLPAGIAKMPFAKFCVFTFLGSFPWCLLLAYLGTLLGNNLERLSPYFHGFDIVILVVLVVLIGLYIWRHIRNDRIARAAQLSNQSAAMQPPPQASQQGWNQQPQQPQQSWNQQPQQPWNQQPWNQGSQQQQPPTQQQPLQPPWEKQNQPAPQHYQLPEWAQQPPQAPQPPQQFQPRPPQPSQPQQQWPSQTDDNDRTVRRG